MGESIKPGKHDYFQYSGLALAYIGDAIHEIYIRRYVIDEGNKPVNKMHRETSGMVNAKAQAELADRIMNQLSEEELTIYKRGRNATSHTVPKNQSVTDYRKATGLEALIGYLYLTERYDRIAEIIELQLKSVKEGKNE